MKHNTTRKQLSLKVLALWRAITTRPALWGLVILLFFFFRVWGRGDFALTSMIWSG